MKVLVTGAAGFIGAHLCDQLEKDGHYVIGIDNFSHASLHPYRKKVQYGDVRYRDTVDELVESVDIVIHCAAQIHVDKSISNPQETFDVNCTGTLNVLEACRKYGKKMIFASSSEVYGTALTDSIDELHQLNSQSPYAASKVFGDRLCHSYNETYGMDVAILRNFNTFGEWQSDAGEGSSYGAVIGIFTRQALNNEPLTIFGDGLQKRDYMWVGDACSAYRFMIDQMGVYNAGTGKTVQILDLARLIIKLTDSQSIIEHLDNRRGEVRKLICNSSKIQKLGWKPTVSFEEGLKRYIEWYKNK